MGLKYEKTDDLDKLFEQFAMDPNKIEKGDIKADIPKEDAEARKKALGEAGDQKLKHKVVK